MKAWHFTNGALRDGRPIPPVGEWLVHDGPVEPCVSGLHASACPLDALKYAPGATVHRVQLRGDLMSHGDPVDKHVGRERRIIWSLDAEPVLRHFARLCALDVIDEWAAPDVVVRYLRTGDQSLREAAESAAESTAWSTAWSAADSAADSAAWAAAAAADTADSAEWSAGYAAASAARSDACSAAWSALSAAAESAARDRQSRRLTRMLREARRGS